MTSPDLASEHLSALRTLEQSLIVLLRGFDPDAMPIDDAIELLFEFAELQQLTASMKAQLERVHPAVAEAARRADASADALGVGNLSVEKARAIISEATKITRRGGAPAA